MQEHHYLLILDDEGRRITSYVVGVHASTMQGLLDIARLEFPGKIYLQDPPPNNYHHELTDPNKVYRNGEIIYSPRKPPLQAIQNIIWDKIKSIRYKHMYEGGIYLNSINKWFCTDIESRQQYLFLSHNNDLPVISWKTMDNSFIEMTHDLLEELLVAISTQDQKNFVNAENHKNAMLLIDNPLCYDYSSGWSNMYGDIN